MHRISRREFLDNAFSAASLAALSPALLPGRARAEDAPAAGGKRSGPNGRVRVATIGVHGQGSSHVEQLADLADVEVAVICDVDPGAISGAMNSVEKKTGKRPAYVQDLRKLFEDKSIDAVTIATPNHWHALAALWAMQAGKDVYVEKPVCHNVREGRRLVEAAAKYGRIAQAGTQRRSMPSMQEAIAYLRSGKLGKVKIARALCYKLRPSIGKAAAPAAIPAGLDYDLWCGPAPAAPPMRLKFHYDWHWFWDYGNGDIGNQGVHEMDLARWGLGVDELPRSAVSVGGRYSYEDDGQTPNTQLSFLDWGGPRIVFEVRGLKCPQFQGAGVGDVFHCEKGWMVSDSYTYAAAFDPDGNRIAEFKGAADRFRPFIDAVKARDPKLLTCPIRENHLSAGCCHLANASYRLGEVKPFDPASKPFGDDAVAVETFDRMREHLAAYDVKLEKAGLRFGRPLTIDPKTETVVGDPQADAMLGREYRKGFEVPAKI